MRNQSLRHDGRFAASLYLHPTCRFSPAGKPRPPRGQYTLQLQTACIGLPGARPLRSGSPGRERHGAAYAVSLDAAPRPVGLDDDATDLKARRVPREGPEETGRSFGEVSRAGLTRSV